MDGKPKPNLFRNIFVRILLISVLILLVREAYVVTIRGERCDYKDFCFFSLTSNSPLAVINDVAAVPKKPISTVDRTNKIYTSKDWIVAVRYYSSLFQDLISSKYLDPSSKSLCVETVNGKDVYALKEVGVSDAIGISKKQFKPLVVSGNVDKIPFDDDVFDFVFAGEFDKMIKQGKFAKEVSRVLKPEGFVVILTKSNDEYSSNSLIHLFNCCTVVRKKEIKGIDSDSKSMKLHEIVLKKENRESEEAIGNVNNNEDNSKCEVPGYKNMLVRKAEPLILEEPLKPWLTLKRNIKNVKYLPSMADINFRGRYVYVDVGARSYGSSIGSWFRKQYPKQNKTFEVYAIEADKAFHEEYKVKKNVKLLPYAAWVRNETLFFEINKDPGHDKDDREGRGMGRIQPVQDGAVSDVNKIQGFDFAQWLKNTVSEKDFVVMKMDVEGTEFDLIPRLFETGAICLIDEIFLECHYNRWQKCCPGERSPKYEKTYDQCLELFTSLRESGVLVHQWW